MTSPLIHQVLAELNEALGQLEEARRYLQMRAFDGRWGRGPAEADRLHYLMAHKVREALTNLRDVLRGLGEEE